MASEISIEEAEERALALIRAVHARSPIAEQPQLSAPQRAFVAKILEANEKERRAQRRLGFAAAFKRLQGEPFCLKMSRAQFLNAVKLEFGRRTWAQK